MKYFLHSPVLPERKVGDLFGLIEVSRGIQDQLSGRVKRSAGEEMLHDAGQYRGASQDQILKMNRQYFRLIEPSQIWASAGDIQEFNIRIRSAENAGTSAR
ncbi:hypothetical protein [Candidatus Villigracilis saccharophilus]|uniref:hypothetical protein n=1 Tax=Candidatus Villigracilis saccharophilus TaxID=3140684 RepID=UPI00313545BB|nr:hypothetical protein [Anaerolineales bacterium]